MLGLQFQLSIRRSSVFFCFMKTIRLSCTVTDLSRKNVIAFSPPGVAAGDLYLQILKGRPDFISVFYCNYTSIMHHFWFNKVFCYLELTSRRFLTRRRCRWYWKGDLSRLMSKNKVGKKRKIKKERTSRSWHFHAFVRKNGDHNVHSMIIINYCTRIKVGNVITGANLCVDISRDMDSGWGAKFGFPIYFMVGPYNCSSVLGMTLNCIHTEWCPGHDVKLLPYFHCHW